MGKSEHTTAHRGRQTDPGLAQGFQLQEATIEIAHSGVKIWFAKADDITVKKMHLL
jgi:hypothetical protein